MTIIRYADLEVLTPTSHEHIYTMQDEFTYVEKRLNVFHTQHIQFDAIYVLTSTHWKDNEQQIGNNKEKSKPGMIFRG